MFFPHRRHKAKRPSDSSINSTDAVRMAKDPQKSSGGLFSYFARARRRLVKSHWETDTLLPTTYPSTTTPSTSNKRHSPAAITCNSFLMGGNYYPGKDKKRRHMRRRTLWYKLFCSSTWRKVTSFLMVAYVLVWHVFLPIGDWLLQVGLTMSAGNHKNRYASNWLQYDSSLKIPELTQEQKISVELAAARARLQYGSRQRNTQRLGILEEIVPSWYHRNDVPKEDKQNKRLPDHLSKGDLKNAELPPATMKEEYKEAAPTKEERKSASEGQSDPTPNNNAEIPLKKNVEESAADENNRSRVLEASGEGLTMRTIHTPSDEASVHSKCEAIDDTKYSTTLVTQLSLSRLWILNETCRRWKDPIVAVVFVPHGQKMSFADLSSIACPHSQFIEYMASPEESELAEYPVNRLRNVGLDAVRTSHVMVMDVDFVPSMGLENKIREALKLQQEHHIDDDDQHALVVPAFERLPPRPCDDDTDCAAYLQTNSSFIPNTFEALQICVTEKKCIVFQSNNNWEGHSTTRSDRWLQRNWYEDEQDKTTFRTIPCFHTARYEPYLVLRWCPSAYTGSRVPVAPYYDERFHGYGKNKIELVSHLRKKGYHFSILPEGFIVHNPHPESSIKEKWSNREGSDLHSSMDRLYSNFMEELETMYKDSHEESVKLCKRDKQ